MGFFSRIFNFNIRGAVNDSTTDIEVSADNEGNSVEIQETPRGWYTMSDLKELSGDTLSGENMTPGKAFSRISTVFACVDRRATALAKLPFGVYYKSDSSRKQATDHRLHYLLTRKPNKYQTPMMYKKYLVLCQLLWGYAVVLKKFDRSGQIAELIPLKPYEVTVNKVYNEDRYLYNYKGVYYTEDEIIYMPYITTDGKIGKSPMSVAREAAGAVQAMTKHLNKFYKNGALRQGALVTSAALGNEAKIKMKQAWAELYGGSANSEEPAILDNGLDFKDISLPLRDAEFIESKRLTAQEIASVFSVPPSMIGLSSEKFSNLQEINDRFMQDVVQPDCINIEEAHNSCFLPSEMNFYTKFNLAAGMRGSDDKRAAFYEKMLQLGVLSINDICELEDRNGVGELGDKHYFSLNYTTLDTLEKHMRIKENNGGDE